MGHGYYSVITVQKYYGIVEARSKGVGLVYINIFHGPS